MKILVVTAMYPHPERPGWGTFVERQVQSLEKRGHVVEVLHILGYRSRWEYARGAARVLRRTWEDRFDVVHAHFGLTGLASVLRWRTPLVITLHGSDALVGRFLPLASRVACAFADVVVAVSPRIAERFPTHVIIPCGVELSEYVPRDRAQARQRLGLHPSRLYVLFPYDPSRAVKRHDLAVSVVEELKRRGRDAELLVVHKVPNAEMPWYYAASDALVLCSTSEGGPTTVKEAIACNVPVATVDVGDVTQVVDGVPIARVVPDTAHDLATAVEELVAQGVPQGFHGPTAMDRFDLAHSARALEEVYRGLRKRR